MSRRGRTGSTWARPRRRSCTPAARNTWPVRDCRRPASACSTPTPRGRRRWCDTAGTPASRWRCPRCQRPTTSCGPCPGTSSRAAAGNQTSRCGAGTRWPRSATCRTPGPARRHPPGRARAGRPWRGRSRPRGSGGIPRPRSRRLRGRRRSPRPIGPGPRRTWFRVAGGSRARRSGSGRRPTAATRRRQRCPPARWPPQPRTAPWAPGERRAPGYPNTPPWPAQPDQQTLLLDAPWGISRLRWTLRR